VKQTSVCSLTFLEAIDTHELIVCVKSLIASLEAKCDKVGSTSFRYVSKRRYTTSHIQYARRFAKELGQDRSANLKVSIVLGKKGSASKGRGFHFHSDSPRHMVYVVCSIILALTLAGS